MLNANIFFVNSAWVNRFVIFELNALYFLFIFCTRLMEHRKI